MMKRKNLFIAWGILMITTFALNAQSPTVNIVSPRPLLAPSSPVLFTGTFTIVGTNLQGATVTTDGPLGLVGAARVNASGTTVKQDYQIGFGAPFEGQSFRLFVGTGIGPAVVVQDFITLNASSVVTITDVTPSPVSPGTGTFTITGTNFTANDEIYTDGQTTLLLGSATASPDGTTIQRSYNIWCCNAGNQTINLFVFDRSNNNYVAVEVPFNAPTPQTINFPPILPKTFGDADFSPGAVASSGLPISYNALGDCVISGSSVHILGAGFCSIQASQPGNGTYSPAPSVFQAFPVGRANANCTVTGYVGIYDGAAHGAAGSCIGVAGVPVSGLTVAPTTYTNVPGGSVAWSFSNPNYFQQSGNALVTILPNPPTNKNACRNGGWQFLTRRNGSRFKNQGSCIKYVENQADNDDDDNDHNDHM